MMTNTSNILYLPNLRFCRLSSHANDDEAKRRFEEVLLLLRRHRNELTSLGHSALPLFSVKMTELPVVNCALGFGDDLVVKVIGMLHDDAVRCR